MCTVVYERPKTISFMVAAGTTPLVGNLFAGVCLP